MKYVHMRFGLVALVTFCLSMSMSTATYARSGCSDRVFCWAIFTPRFAQAAQRIIDDSGDPGTAINDPHEWNGIGIQDYRGSQWGDGAVIADKSTMNPQYIGGGEWAAFKTSLYTYNTWPGYPINGAHIWNGIHIQDMRGGLHGDGAFIGGANAKFVTWRIWPVYIRVDGSRSLRNPLTYAVPRQDGHGNWYDVQQFEGGEIWSRKQGVSVYFFNRQPPPPLALNYPAIYASPRAAVPVRPPSNSPQGTSPWPALTPGSFINDETTVWSGGAESSLTFGEGHQLRLHTNRTSVGVDYTVTLVEPSGESRLILSESASDVGVQPPTVQYSQGNGAAFMIFSSNGSDIRHLAIYRSDTGGLLCAGPGSFHPTSPEILGAATANGVRISFADDSGPHQWECPRS